MSTESSLPPEARFGQYRVVRPLGRGGMGEVYEVEHTTLERRYALKLLPPDFAARPEAVMRFRREARVMANLEHPHIVRVDEFGETNGRYWLRMELVRGVETGLKAESGKQKAEIGSLGARCITLGDYAASRNGRIAQAEFAGILKQLLEAVAYAHEKGVVHRDLKPGNILLEKDPQGQLVVKVSDFGLARVIGEELIRSQAQMSVTRSLSLVAGKLVGATESIGDAKTLEEEGTSTRALLGTWEYMAPEQRRGEEADARSDVYALGLMCYRLLTGEELGMRTPSRIVGELSVAWDAFLEKALEQKPAARYASGREMLDASVEVARAIEAASEVARQETLRRAEAERRRQEAEAVRQREAEAVERRQEEERQREAARRLEAERQRAEAEQVEAQRRRRAAEEQAMRHSRRPRVLRGRLWAVGILAVAVVCFAAWYWGIHVPAQERARREQNSREQQSAQQAVNQKKREDAAAETARLEAEKKRKEDARLETERKEREAAAAEAARLEAEKKARQPLVFASPDHPWENSLGMKFVRVPETKVLFCVWDVRVKDYETYAAAGPGVDNSWKNPGFEQEPTHPVVNVSWNDANAFCRWLTETERKAGLLSGNQSYRLPTDVEWSVAVELNEKSDGTPREKDGKIRGVYPWGSDLPPLSGVGNYGSSLNVDNYERTSPVGRFKSNRHGLYDMGGNVWQWCEDFYDGQSGSRVLRGASWNGADPNLLLSSYRSGYMPGNRFNFIGFRCVLMVGSSP